MGPVAEMVLHLDDFEQGAPYFRKVGVCGIEIIVRGRSVLVGMVLVRVAEPDIGCCFLSVTSGWLLLVSIVWLLPVVVWSEYLYDCCNDFRHVGFLSTGADTALAGVADTAVAVIAGVAVVAVRSVSVSVS